MFESTSLRNFRVTTGVDIAPPPPYLSSTPKPAARMSLTLRLLTLLAQLVAAGELPLAWVFAHRVESMRVKGAPIDWISTLDPIIVTLGPIALGPKPPHPNAARLLIDYVLSHEGQVVLQGFERIPSRSDVKPRTARLDRRQLPLLPLDPKLGHDIKTHMDRFRSFFGLQR